MSSPGAAFCPCCGFNMEAERPVAIGPLQYDPRGRLTWQGEAVPLAATELLVLGSLIQARGRLVSRAALAERIGHEGDSNVVAVLLSRCRARLRAAGLSPALIENTPRRGWRFAAEQLDEAA